MNDEDEKEEYDFKEHYKIGDIIYLVRYIENLDIEEVKELRLRTIMKTYMVGNKEKDGAEVIGRDRVKIIFHSLKEAKDYLKTIKKTHTKKQKYEIPRQLDGLDEEDEDDIDKYIDSDEGEE